MTDTIKARELASFDPERNLWIIEPGEYKVYMGHSSSAPAEKGVAFKVEEEIVVASEDDALPLPEGFSADKILNVVRE